MNKAMFYIEIKEDKIIEHGNIQFSGAKFLVNHSASKKYSYNLVRQKHNKNAFDIFYEDCNKTYFEVFADGLTYTYNYGDGNVICLSYARV